MERPSKVRSSSSGAPKPDNRAEGPASESLPTLHDRQRHRALIRFLETSCLIIKIDEVTREVERDAQQVTEDSLANSPDAASWSSPKAA